MSSNTLFASIQYQTVRGILESGRMSEFKDAVNMEHRVAAIRTMMRHFGCDSQATIRESILVRGGMFCGRKFSADGFIVIWFIEEDQIKYYAPSGDLIASLNSQSCVEQAEQLQTSEPQPATFPMSIPTAIPSHTPNEVAPQRKAA